MITQTEFTKETFAWAQFAKAAAVLAAFPPMYGVTETGDADVCAALDAAGARIEE